MSTRSGTGVVRLLPQDQFAAIEASAHAGAASVVRVDLARCHDKAGLLARVAGAFAFPATFGRNWDALADCLNDLGWLPRGDGYVWLFDHADDLQATAPLDLATFVEILDAACRRWAARNVACEACIGFDHPRPTAFANPPHR